MKRYLIIIGAILLGLSVKAQSVTYRYWFDKNLAQAVTTTFSGSNWQAELDVGSLTDGLHTLHFHAMDTSMIWSAPESHLFLKVSDMPTTQLPYLYWFDRDMENMHGGNIGNGQLFLDVDELESGMHTLHLMVNGTENNAVRNFLFIKNDAMGPDGGSYTYRCWFDRDFDNQQTDTLGIGHLLLNVDGLTEGFHTVHVMLEGSTFSSTLSYLFLKVSPVEGEIQYVYHYWFDRDFDNRMTDSLSDGNILFDVDGLKDGLHTLHVILEGTDMATTESYMFLKIAVQEPEQELQYNCWFDEDHDMLLTGSVGNGYFLVPVGMLPVGDHNLYMQVNDGTLSSPEVYSFYRTPMVNVISNPVDGGTATGQLIDSICTLTAQPAPGFVFASWMTIFGEVLSTSPFFTFILTEDASIVANFVRIGYNITATANPVEGGTVTGGGIFIIGQTCTLTATPNEGYVFTNWTKNGEVVSTNATYSFTVTADGAYVANFEQGITQTSNLAQGWNWFSTYLDITLDDLKDALVDALPGTTNIRINSQSGTVSYNGRIWRGTLNSLDVTRMYLIQVNSACVLTLTGQPLNPAMHPVIIHNGSNWIGYQFGESMSLLNAFFGFAVNGDKVISQSGTSTYNGRTWRGTLNSLAPGQGYIFNSSVQGDRTFTFPIGTK